MAIAPESSWARTYPHGPIHATSTWPLASATEIPAQSVVAIRSYSRPRVFARWAKNGSYAFLVSEGVGWSGPTPKRSFPDWAGPGAGVKKAIAARTTRTTL